MASDIEIKKFVEERLMPFMDKGLPDLERRVEAISGACVGIAKAVNDLQAKVDGLYRQGSGSGSGLASVAKDKGEDKPKKHNGKGKG